jgi:hypothetical protein
MADEIGTRVKLELLDDTEACGRASAAAPATQRAAQTVDLPRIARSIA